MSFIHPFLDGNPNRTTETFLVIEIFDTNDHSPIFTKTWYNTTIPESLPVGTILLTVKATDLDTVQTLIIFALILFQ